MKPHDRVEQCHRAVKDSVNYDLPPANRLWGLASYLRDKHFWGKMPDLTLRDLVVDVLCDCKDRFDPKQPPREGLCRMSVQDRFMCFFEWKLKRRIIDLSKKKRRDRRDGRFRRAAYKGPRGDKYETARQPEDRTALYELLHRSIERLAEVDEKLIDLAYFTNPPLSLEAIAEEIDMPNRFKVSRELDRVRNKLRSILLSYLSDEVTELGDDLEKWEKSQDGCSKPEVARTYITQTTISSHKDGHHQVA